MCRRRTGETLSCAAVYSCAVAGAATKPFRRELTARVAHRCRRHTTTRRRYRRHDHDVDADTLLSLVLMPTEVSKRGIKKGCVGERKSLQNRQTAAEIIMSRHMTCPIKHPPQSTIGQHKADGMQAAGGLLGCSPGGFLRMPCPCSPHLRGVSSA